ncbi:hypothetical protein SAMN06297422_11849 [Lachnospiraceae bacterium]|nr:hypothetical protein SAMN06297422_11849 [Lachnospiraceae bacterium]
MKTNITNNQKLFLTDLDGTILNDQKIITPETISALTEFVSAGNVFAICTGRDINSARSVYDGLGVKLPGSFVIAFNGGQIYDVDNKKTVYRTGIDVKMGLEILKLARDRGIHVHTYNDDFILTVDYNECVEYYRKVIKTPVIVCDDIGRFMDKPLCKMICIELHDHEKQEDFRREIERLYGDSLELMYSNEYYLELIPKGSGKGSALRWLADYLEIKPGNTMAAGDADNDSSMVSAAGLGIAMINGDDKIKLAADVITEKDNNNDGLAPYISNFI